mgnify:CR=1 FL=1
MDDSFSHARMSLLLDHPFFGSLIMHLEPKPDADAKRGIWVDGQTIGYNKEAIDAMPLTESGGLLAKGVLHCAFRHQLRRGDRDQKLWQRACDLSINPLVFDSGLRLPAGALIDRQRFPDNTPEDIYQQLDQGNDQQQLQGGQGAGQPQPGQGQGDIGQSQPQTGEVRDSPGDEEGHDLSPADASAQEQEWKIKLQQAVNNAQSHGDLPAGLKRLIEQALAPVVDWKAELRRFFQALARDDLSWSRPNRRFIGAGIYLPAVHSERMGPMVIAVDTSGSIGARALTVFGAEINAIIEDVSPERVHVVYCDAEVNHVDEFDSDTYPIKLQPVGGGGTRFEPVFDWIEQQGIFPTCLVYLTDTYGSFPKKEPDYPVLWASTGGSTVPFGDLLKIDPTQERNMR